MTDIGAGARRGPGPQRRPALVYWALVVAVVVTGWVVLGYDHDAPHLILICASPVVMVVGFVQATRAWRAHPVPPDLGFGDTNRMGEAGYTPDRVVALPARLRAPHLARIQRWADTAAAGGPWLFPAFAVQSVVQLTRTVTADDLWQQVWFVCSGLMFAALVVVGVIGWRRARALLDHPDVIEAESRDGADG